jgi:hypothetical protein
VVWLLLTKIAANGTLVNGTSISAGASRVALANGDSSQVTVSQIISLAAITSLCF